MRVLWALAGLLAACGGLPTSEVAHLRDLDGQAVDPFARDVTASVFVFTLTDCPISNRYAPELRRLQERFEPGGVAFYLVYPDAETPATAIREHRAAFGHRAAALRDPEHWLVERTGASVTPEAAVFDAVGELVYRGRIDDRWVSFGEPRAAPTRHDLAEVLAAIVAGEAPAPRTTRAVGCFIPERS